jgi:hypothetical protein
MGPDYADLIEPSQEKYEHIWMRGYMFPNLAPDTSVSENPEGISQS